MEIYKKVDSHRMLYRTACLNAFINGRKFEGLVEAIQFSVENQSNANLCRMIDVHRIDGNKCVYQSK